MKVIDTDGIIYAHWKTCGPEFMYDDSRNILSAAKFGIVRDCNVVLCSIVYTQYEIVDEKKYVEFLLRYL